MSNQKNEWDFQDNATKKEFRVLYDVLKRAKLPLSTEHNAVYGLDDAVLVLLYMCKNCITANRTVTELGITFRDDRSGSIPTAQWLLGMIDAMDPDKMDALCRRMLKSTIKDGSGLERKTGHMLAIDKHLIPFTGANRHNDRLVISGKPKGGTSRFETYATMQVGDSPMLVPLLDEALEVVTRTCRTQDSDAGSADAGCCLYGDATYASRDNVTACRDRGAESRIKLGVNSSGRGEWQSGNSLVDLPTAMCGRCQMMRKSACGKNGKRRQGTAKGGWWRSCSLHSSGCSASTCTR